MTMDEADAKAYLSRNLSSSVLEDTETAQVGKEYRGAEGKHY